MGMSTHVVGYRDIHSSQHKKMVAALSALREAGIAELPSVMEQYFSNKYGYVDGPDAGLEVEIPSHKWSEDMKQGYEVILKELPEGVEVIRFYNSW